MRERLTMTKTTMGSAVTSLENLSSSGQVRLKLEAHDGRVAGFVTICSWSADEEAGPGSARSTPSHGQEDRAMASTISQQRSQSLPTIQRRNQKIEQPSLLPLFKNPYTTTYKLHSGLGGDISVSEIMLEPNIALDFPKQLLSLLMREERSCVQEVAGMGELPEPWHSNQMNLLTEHLRLHTEYGSSLKIMDKNEGSITFKKSAWKADPSYEFYPTNLHLQRMWAQNATLRKTNFYDIYTVGAFSAHSRKTKSLGPQKQSSTEKLQEAELSLKKVLQLRRDIIDCINSILKMCQVKKSSGLGSMVETLMEKTKQISAVSQIAFLGESLTFIESNRNKNRASDDLSDSESVAAFMERNVKCVKQESSEAHMSHSHNSHQDDSDILDNNELNVYYREGDELEPIDLTLLNIEASMICLTGKLQQLTNAKVLEDWAEEVRPSMRKLRQGMDSLLKTTRMMCSVFRLQQSPEAVRLTASVKHRRDICFSQALTSLVSALMSRLWSHPPDPVFLSVLTQIGPLVYFEGLLSMHGEDVTIFNDMIVAIEDLRAVEFQFDTVENMKEKEQHPPRYTTRPASLSDESIPLPTVTGSRTNIKVYLPAPGWVYTSWKSKSPPESFSIVPVFFNIGINEKATIADKMGKNGPQEMNNLENYNHLAKYVEALSLLDIEDKPLRGGLSNQIQLDELMMKLKRECSSKKNKNVEILSLSSEICLLLNGLRFTSCKSGKDRTGMSVTLEQVNILSREFDLDEKEYSKALDTMRSVGTRRHNCWKNIDLDKYAFTTTQLATFPRHYRAPVGSYGSKLT